MEHFFHGEHVGGAPVTWPHLPCENLAEFCIPTWTPLWNEAEAVFPPEIQHVPTLEVAQPGGLWPDCWQPVFIYFKHPCCHIKAPFVIHSEITTTRRKKRHWAREASTYHTTAPFLHTAPCVRSLSGREVPTDFIRKMTLVSRNIKASLDLGQTSLELKICHLQILHNIP